MPYITEERRSDLMHNPEAFPRNSGELNFLLTQVILEYLPEAPHYSDYNEVIGVLECMKQEFYRRVVATYEDKKCEENGEVYV